MPSEWLHATVADWRSRPLAVVGAAGTDVWSAAFAAFLRNSPSTYFAIDQVELLNLIHGEAMS
jgi:hypothetical protein